MPLQPGEVLLGSWEPYLIEPRTFDYEDPYREVSPDGAIFRSVIREYSTGGQYHQFANQSFGISTPFDGQYTRFDYDTVLYKRSLLYVYTYSREDGTTGKASVSTTSFCKSPDTVPIALPHPTLSDIADLPSLLTTGGNAQSPLSPIASISWLPTPGGLVLETYNPPLFLPGRNPNGSETGFVAFSALRDPSLLHGQFIDYYDGTSILPTKINFYKRANKPTYYDLLRGYRLDDRTINNSPEITITEKKSIAIGYYRENRLEPIPELRSIDWLTYKCDIPADTVYTLPIVDCVLGTLEVSDLDIANEINSLVTPSGKYPFKYYFSGNLAELFAGWYALYNPNNTVQSLDASSNGILETRILRKLGANNNHWNNRPSETPDLNVELSHPMFIIDTARSSDWHLSPQSEGIGTLIMDSPRTVESHAYLIELRKAFQAENYQVENLTSDPPAHYLDWYIKNSGGEKLNKIYKALDAEQWGTNADDPEIPRVANLGHLISKIASLLGYRPEHDGTFDPAKEKALVRQIVNNNAPIDPTKIGVNNFGSLGMIMRRLNNSFKGKKIVADECVILRDIPQIMAEYQDQLNLALGLQESSAIEIKGNDNTARYENQLAVMIELLNLVKSSNESIRAALISSLVAQAQSSEIIAALGLPTVTKSLPVTIDNKIDHLPYKGVSAHRSISQEIAVCTANVGIVLGQVL